MNATPMSLQRLAAICAAYGGDPRRWPAAERAAAQALAASSSEARSLIAQAAALDQALDAEPARPVPPALRARVLAAMPRGRERLTAREFFIEFFSWRPALPALALALVCGIAVGLWIPAAPQAEDEFDVALASAFQEEPEDY